MADIKVCTISQEVKDAARKLRFRKDKNNAAIVVKIDMKAMDVVIDDEYDDCSIEEVMEELPEFSPRYILLSYCYNHDDGRVSFPLMFIGYTPGGVKPEMNMVYAGTRPALVKDTNMNKVYELREKEEFTEEWVQKKCAFFT
eukprot:CAMPEP_0182916584 /NCGR_PEP_ID=MMETSP0105_2-20130417/1031_1 /TAXON_ID=81532 ORGANISM="Acanthoeca-like sp., Strain 10tr" /NCGR_SAMPLE_ID=MMETSP0105_2 /ASSEMBLY_ACC=CAM_ASM_000205 /LENGTH=141 /DNA_ID=CAMNT_0025053549 /DNA_START=26 /DNA_END=451 /DNA_ORIENTATION=-